jgi:hypothetical protein
VDLSLSAESELARIENNAFEGCCVLTSMFLPSSVEFVGESCFENCVSLSSLRFGSPSHLRELLDLPRPLSGVIDIPDSVETLGLFGSFREQANQVLRFGVDSRLNQIKAAKVKDARDTSLVRRSLLLVSTRSVKMMRMNLEFEAV